MINNLLNLPRSLHPNQYYENHGNTNVSEKPVPDFNLKDYFFGKKDLLLEYGNLRRDKAYNDSMFNSLRQESNVVLKDD